MFWRKKELKASANSRTVRSPDPLNAFKKNANKEFSRYDIPGELWKGVRKLLYIALVLLFIWFAKECYLSWNIFN